MKLTNTHKILIGIGVVMLFLLLTSSRRKKSAVTPSSSQTANGGGGVGSDYDYLDLNSFPLKFGKKNNYVRCLQRWLNNSKDLTGITRLTVDGDFGNATLSALRKTWRYYFGYETSEITREQFSREGMSAFDY